MTMKFIDKYLGRAFAVASVYLVSIILVGFFILPSLFNIDNYDVPVGLELFLKATATLAVSIVLASSIYSPISRIRQRDYKFSQPFHAATISMLTGFSLLLFHGLYVKLKTCSIGDTAWHCNVDGKSYVGMSVLILFISTTIGFSVWVNSSIFKR
jgi:hypothetical protein